ncbi:hypothetical protein Tco_0698308 [Tanacetum coccineum]
MRIYMSPTKELVLMLALEGSHIHCQSFGYVSLRHKPFEINQSNGGSNEWSLVGQQGHLDNGESTIDMNLEFSRMTEFKLWTLSLPELSFGSSDLSGVILVPSLGTFWKVGITIQEEDSSELGSEIGRPNYRSLSITLVLENNGWCVTEPERIGPGVIVDARSPGLMCSGAL